MMVRLVQEVYEEMMQPCMEHQGQQDLQDSQVPPVSQEQPEEQGFHTKEIQEALE
jgi:hypothetical protein